MREVRVYEHDFPTYEQMLAGGPDASGFPKEVWLQQVQPGEFAVRYKDFKTGTGRNPEGKHVHSSEICRIFGSLEEARADSRGVVNSHWTVYCAVYDHAGAWVETISNSKQLRRYAVAVYASMLYTILFFGIAGMGSLWILWEIGEFVLGSVSAVHQFSGFGWSYWTRFVLAGLLLTGLVWYMLIRFKTNRTVSRTREKLDRALSLEDKQRFAALNYLHSSRNPADRKRFVNLAKEYGEKIGEALKK